MMVYSANEHTSSYALKFKSLNFFFKSLAAIWRVSPHIAREISAPVFPAREIFYCV